MNLNDLEQLELEEESLSYLTPRARIPQRFSLEKTHSPFQLMLADREKDFLWDTKTCIADRNAYYALCNKYKREKGETALVGILNWGREHNCHIRQVLKVLSR